MATVAPASNEKLPVSWAALTTLGPGYRFHTEVYGVGTRPGPTWDGNLVLKGFGDPTLATADLDPGGTAEDYLDAFEKMINQAMMMGANAIIGVRYDATEVMQGVTAYGALKRLVDPKIRSPWAWLVEGKIVGLDEAAEAAKKSGKFDYNAKIPGLEVVDRYTLRIRLTQPDLRFLYALAVPNTAAVAREVIEAFLAERAPDEQGGV